MIKEVEELKAINKKHLQAAQKKKDAQHRESGTMPKEWQDELTNPPNPKKVSKAKKKFKKFHGGKKPDNVSTQQIDVGDVWYCLGEAWQIGYMSPKETGSEGQKYIHTMNEESKDGDFPKLYATIPDNGEPLLIIKGGSLRIEERGDGIEWLVD
jgi:hypothetical protein